MSDILLPLITFIHKDNLAPTRAAGGGRLAGTPVSVKNLSRVRYCLSV